MGTLRDADLGLPVRPRRHRRRRRYAARGHRCRWAGGWCGQRGGGHDHAAPGQHGIVPRDPEQHPWVSAHLAARPLGSGDQRGLHRHEPRLARAASAAPASTSWPRRPRTRPRAPGASPRPSRPRTWSEETWSSRRARGLIGFEPGHDRADVARAFIEAHAYGIRGNLEDLERATGGLPAGSACSAGPLARDRSPSSWPTSPAGRSAGRECVSGRPRLRLAGRRHGATSPPRHPTSSATPSTPAQRCTRGGLHAIHRRRRHAQRGAVRVDGMKALVTAEFPLDGLDELARSDTSPCMRAGASPARP